MALGLGRSSLIVAPFTENVQVELTPAESVQTITQRHALLVNISIRHFQHGGVCLHFTHTVFGTSIFKITLIFSELTLHFNYIV